MKNNIKVLSVFSSTHIYTGGHKRLFKLLSDLSDKGARCSLITNSLIHHDTIQICHLLSPKKKGIVPITIRSLLKLIRHNNHIKELYTDTDVILIFGMTDIISGIYLKIILKKPLIFCIRSNIYQYRQIHIDNKGIHIFKDKHIKVKFLNQLYMKVYNSYLKAILKFPNLITVQNEEEQQNLLTKFHLLNKKIKVIPNNINESYKAYNTTNKSTRLRQLIFIGELSKRKGIEDLVTAFCQLKHKFNDIELLIIGEGVMKSKLMKIINEYHVEDIQFIGYISNPLSVIAKADLLVVPSLQDSYPNVILEAMACGTPIIGSSVGGIKAIIRNTDLLFEPQNVPSLINCIERLLNEEQYQYSKLYFDSIRANFYFDWADKYMKIIKLLVSGDKCERKIKGGVDDMNFFH